MLRTKLAILGLLGLAACAGPSGAGPTVTALDPTAITILATTAPAPTQGCALCTAVVTSGATPTMALPTATVAPDPTSTHSETLTPTDNPDTRPAPEQWQDWPVIPTLSANAKALYQAGLAAGNNPHAFSKIGDCQNINSFFLAAFDNPKLYTLGPTYASLQPAIDQFHGMFSRESAAVRNGFNVAAVLSPLQADPAICQAGENPVACELRINHPSIVLISMETWWAGKPAAEYEKYMRQVLDLVIAQKALPILATKADNLEGDFSINATLARLAYEYDIPLWNFWKAVQPLPNGGLSKDGFHLTNDSLHPADPLLYQRLSEPSAGNFGWAVRNVTALQVIDSVWRQASAP